MDSFGYHMPVALLFTVGAPEVTWLPDVSDPEAQAEEGADSVSVVPAQEPDEQPADGDEGAYVPAPPVDYRALGITEEHIPELIRLATDMELYHGDYPDTPEDMDDESAAEEEERAHTRWYGVIHAWYALAQLEAEEAAAPLLEMLRAVTDDEDDWGGTVLPQVLTRIGRQLFPVFARELADNSGSEFFRMDMGEIISNLGLLHADMRAQAVQVFTDELAQYRTDQRVINGAIVASLLKMKAVDSIDVVRKAYEKDVVSLVIAGDIEEVEIAFGLRTERSTPAQNWFEVEADNYPMEGMDGLWNDDLLEGGEDEPEVARTPVVRSGPKVGRNDPCPCGSGKKYKKCCMA